MPTAETHPSVVAGTWKTPGVQGHREAEVTPGPVAAEVSTAGGNAGGLEHRPSTTRVGQIAVGLLAAMGLVLSPLYGYTTQLGVVVFDSLAVWLVLVMSTAVLALVVGRRSKPHLRAVTVLGSVVVGFTINFLVVYLVACVWAVI